MNMNKSSEKSRMPDRWMPVSKRNPEKKGRYVVTIHPWNEYKGKPDAKIAVVTESDFDPSRGWRTELKGDEVLAWRPAISPWMGWAEEKEEQEEERPATVDLMEAFELYAYSDLSMTNLTDWTSTVIRDEEDCIVSFEWHSLENGKPTGTGVLQIRNVWVGPVDQGTVTLNLKDYLDYGLNCIRVSVTDIYNQRQMLRFLVTKVAKPD